MPDGIVFLADMHLGEGCASARSDYRLNDTACYSYRRLNATVAKINELAQEHPLRLKLVLVGGDVTSSAQASEYAAARVLLDSLTVPYLPVMGNHDMWSYDQVRGDRTPTPSGDGLFAATFSHRFRAHARRGGLTYPNVTVHDPRHNNATSRFQSWELQLTAEDGADLAGMVVLAPDFNTRDRALPPCPGSSPVGGCGTPGNAELHDFDNGTLPWFASRLDALDVAHRPKGSIVLLTHQPFRCRFPIPDWYFCFSTAAKATLRELIDSHGGRAAFWGQLAGHQHRWYDGTAMDESAWRGFRQWENSAVKGDFDDHAMAASFSVLSVRRARITATTRYWQEHGRWVADERPETEMRDALDV